MSPQTVVAEKGFDPASAAAGGKNEVGRVTSVSDLVEEPDASRKEIRKTSFFAVAGCVSSPHLLCSLLEHTPLNSCPWASS